MELFEADTDEFDPVEISLEVANEQVNGELLFETAVGCDRSQLAHALQMDTALTVQDLSGGPTGGERNDHLGVDRCERQLVSRLRCSEPGLEFLDTRRSDRI